MPTKKKAKKNKPINWGEVLDKAKELENLRKVDEVKYHVRRLHELLLKDN